MHMNKILKAFYNDDDDDMADDDDADDGVRGEPLTLSWSQTTENLKITGFEHAMCTTRK